MTKGIRTGQWQTRIQLLSLQKQAPEQISRLVIPIGRYGGRFVNSLQIWGQLLFVVWRIIYQQQLLDMVLMRGRDPLSKHSLIR
nr:MAG TPA: hypothetical protein [Caudoviricetes sp.]